jgi:hypothetical protein
LVVAVVVQVAQVYQLQSVALHTQAALVFHFQFLELLSHMRPVEMAILTQHQLFSQQEQPGQETVVAQDLQAAQV